jgi:hypothetical protein
MTILYEWCYISRENTVGCSTSWNTWVDMIYGGGPWLLLKQGRYFFVILILAVTSISDFILLSTNNSKE